MAGALTIGQAARRSGLAARTIRYYEQIGVLPIPARSASGYRAYREADVERLRFIGRARALGVPLARLRMLTSAFDGGARRTLRPRLVALVREQLATVQRRIAEAEALRRELQQVSTRLHRARRAEHDGACGCLEAPPAGRQRRRGS
jgi:MerR family copper efflux transcriptional regulator